MQHRYC